jgi:Putative prokaryotic signal transducing protein
MSVPSDLVTVYRSMDATAKEDCEVIVDVLTAEGLSPIILDDSAPGVPEGAFEVQVPPNQLQKAEELIAEHPLPDEVEEVDDSSDLDLETIFHADGTLAEVESMEIKNLLEANGVAAVVVGNSVLPTMSFEVRVAHDQVERAREVVNEAQAAGPMAAEKAEALFESETAETPKKANT